MLLIIIVTTFNLTKVDFKISSLLSGSVTSTAYKHINNENEIWFFYIGCDFAIMISDAI